MQSETHRCQLLTTINQRILIRGLCQFNNLKTVRNLNTGAPEHNGC